MATIYQLPEEQPIKIEHGDTIRTEDILHIRDKIHDYTSREGKPVKVKRYYYHLRDGRILLLPWSAHHNLQRAIEDTRRKEYKFHVKQEGSIKTYGVEPL